MIEKKYRGSWEPIYRDADKDTYIVLEIKIKFRWEQLNANNKRKIWENDIEINYILS